MSGPSVAFVRNVKRGRVEAVNPARNTYKSARYAPLKTAFARNVRRVLHREMEKKTSQYRQVDKALYGYNATGTAWADSIFPVTPFGASLIINQGVGDGGRVGNRIKITHLRFKGVVVPLAYNATSNVTPEPQYVKMWLFYDKENPTILPTPGSDFLQDGSTSTALTGTVSDVFAPVNSDRWVVKHEQVFKLGFAGYSGTGVNAGFQSFANNDFSLACEFDIDVMPMIPKTYIYDDNSAIPETRGLFCAMEVVNCYGSQNGAATIKAEMHWQLDMKYTDQ